MGMDEQKRRGPARTKRTDLLLRADETYLRLLVLTGGEIRDARKRRGMTQTRLGERAGMSRSGVSRVERGDAAAVPLRDVVRLAVALDLVPRLSVGRDPIGRPSDAGHLAIQELLLRLGRSNGYGSRVELPVGRGDLRHSIDVCLVDRSARRLLIQEAWNTFGDLGAAARSFDRKLAAAEEIATGMGLEGATIHGVWVVRSTRANRALVARYPEFITSRFPGSSRAWAAAIVRGGAPPVDPGLVWTDLAATRVFAHRARLARGTGPLPA